GIVPRQDEVDRDHLQERSERSGGEKVQSRACRDCGVTAVSDLSSQWRQGFHPLRHTKPCTVGISGLPPSPEDETDHFGHRGVELVRDRLVDLHPAQRLGKHWIGLDDNPMLPRDLEDALGNVPAPLGHHHRRRMRTDLVVERHRQLPRFDLFAHDTLSNTWPDAGRSGSGTPPRTLRPLGISPTASSALANSGSVSRMAAAVSGSAAHSATLTALPRSPTSAPTSPVAEKLSANRIDQPRLPAASRRLPPSRPTCICAMTSSCPMRNGSSILSEGELGLAEFVWGSASEASCISLTREIAESVCSCSNRPASRAASGSDGGSAAIARSGSPLRGGASPGVRACGAGAAGVSPSHLLSASRNASSPALASIGCGIPRARDASSPIP